MNAFIKTFFICLILTLGFLFYQFLSGESYDNNLHIAKDNPLFNSINMNKYSSNKEDNSNYGILEKENIVDEAQNKPSEIEKAQSQPIEKKPQIEKYTYTCYFFSQNGDLVPLKRKLVAKPTLENTLNLLLKGPLISETKKGYYSEIPPNVDLINVKRQDKSIIINLSSNFGNGGGSQSVENRVKQLSKTAKAFASGKDIYLYVDGQEVEYLGGDGVYIKQPL